MYEFIGAKNQYYRIKLNYKCEFNGTDNKCDITTRSIDSTTKKFWDRVPNAEFD